MVGSWARLPELPRRPRALIEGGVYHVYNRFARGEDVFADPEEAIGFVELLRAVKQRDEFVVFAWCVMSNHYHFAVRSSAVPLPRTMQFLQGRFSRDFNRRWGRTGPLWQSRYKAKLIEEPGYLPRVIQYIHLNPVKAGLAEDPSKYTFSGHRELIGKISKPLCDVDESLLCFGQTKKTARRSYLSSVRRAMEDGGSAEEIVEMPWWTRDKELELDDSRVHIDVLGRTTGLERPRLEARDFVAMASGLLDIEIEQLSSRRQDAETARLRRVVASLGVERWGQRAGALAKVLNKHSVVVSRWVSQGRQLREDDEVFSTTVETLDTALSELAIRKKMKPESNPIR